MAGLREVARRAGVSVATASRVASGANHVRPETRHRVERAMHELLYVPHQRGLATRTVGLLVPELTNPVFPGFAQAIEARAAEAGLASILCNTAWRPNREAQYVRMLLDRRVDGMVFISSELTDLRSDHSIFDRLLDRRVPFVLVNGGAYPRATTVSIDERAGTRLATEHLLDLGHKRIGLVVRPEFNLPAREKSAGWKAALLAAGIEPDLELIGRGDYSVRGGSAALRRLMERGSERPTAVVCGADIMAVGALHEALGIGLPVPAGLSIVGFDGIPQTCWTVPPLTTIEQPVDEIAETAVTALLSLIEDPTRELPDFVFRPRLRVRGSTAPPP